MIPNTYILIHKTSFKYLQLSVWHFMYADGIDVFSKIIHWKPLAFSFITYTEQNSFKLINQLSKTHIRSFLF